MTDAPPGEDPLALVLDTLAELGVRHHLGGSYASSLHEELLARAMEEV